MTDERDSDVGERRVDLAVETSDEGLFTCLYPVERLPGQGRHVKLRAESQHFPELARDLGVDAVESLSADLVLTPKANGELVRLTGTVQAKVRQTCGITLKTLISDVSDQMDRIYSFSQEQEQYTPNAEIQLDLESEDPADPVVDGHVDLAAAVIEQLVLAIDPFPRAEGAEYAPLTEDETVVSGPFAALSALRTAKIDKI